MRNISKKINLIAPAAISAAMLIALSAAVYGFDGRNDQEMWPPYLTSDSESDPTDTGEISEDTTTADTSISDSDSTTTTSFSFPTPTTPPVTGTRPTGTTPPPVTTTPDVSGQDSTTPPAVTVPTQTEPPITEDTTPDGSDTTTEPSVVLPPELVISFSERWLTAGEGVQLNAQVLNTDQYYPVSFSSSNPSVAMVDASGYIMAIGPGSAVITAYSGDLAAYATVYVTAPEAVPEYIFLAENNFVLKIDQAVQIQARLLPEETAAGYLITFTSADPSIASVDENGVITALSEGATTVTVEGAGLSETVYVTVSADMSYSTARLDGYLYDGTGKPMAGNHLMIDGMSAITDMYGYFVFESVEQRSITIVLADDSSATCGLTVTGNTTVFLLYDQGMLTRMSSYEELVGRLAINSAAFVSADIVLTAGDVYELAYQYEPSNASVTGISYTSSNTVAATVGQLDGVVTAKSPGVTTITLILNNGQAQAICTITVNPKESSEHSALIIIIEGAVFAAGAAAVAISYRKYKKAHDGEDDEEENNLHDID